MSAATQYAKREPGPRQILWIDGVGGFLLCLGDKVVLGHANGRPVPDVPLLADVSRLHAVLERDAEGYALQAARRTQVNGHEVQRATLRSGDRITLGASCQLLFTQPLPLSASARLELASGHRLAAPVSSVLLMAQALVLSSGNRGHVCVPDLPAPIIIRRHKDALAVSYDGAIVIEGQTWNGTAPLDLGRTVTIGDVSFTLDTAKAS